MGNFVEITKEYRDLIENIVKTNARFTGNEDLLEDFCSETFKRSYSIMSSVNTISNIQSYLKKVANSSILEVLRSSGRLKRTAKGFVATEETIVTRNLAYRVDEFGNMDYDISDPAVNTEREIIRKEDIERISEAIKIVDSNEEEKNYLKIFKMRFVENKKQREISDRLEISQGEVSKRLVELSQKVKAVLNSQDF